MQDFFGAIIGGSIGAVAASVTDAAALAWSPVATPPIAITPAVSASRFTVNISGAF